MSFKASTSTNIFPSRAPPPTEVESITSESTHSLIDVDTPHVSTVPSTFSSQEIQTDTQAARIEREEQAADARAKAQAAADKAKAKSRRAGGILSKNADNPVVLGNLVTAGLLTGVLGLGAYRKYTAGELSWKVAGAWAGAVGLFAAADYFVSQRLFQKYPPKK
ncbi:hypothetical protein EJ05DRAFT_205661 [Pseudovirgaria hyperparasitica]|uniref:Uncharacterized protein n=1 Tax=Pseudovirgaria hyperparasitica TaxID=470096 RepID=A0A6A6WJG5_9PEZI|nr:uncharacterized protein EJ05DRAFT_205661 [Pseudovirgaria hyperparasitica]KAF2762320.1 hypothetical protein EJ05DRAFT_205661 [Pseudovirgaria hyperparasitica]